MSRYDTTKARDALAGHAVVNGWTTRDGEMTVTFRKGHRSVTVRFSRNGEIFKASVLGVRAITGRNKLQQVIEELNRV